MRAECIQAVQMAAQKIGKTLTASDMRGMEAKIYEARKQIAKQDINSYRNMTTEEQLTAAGERVVNDALHAAIKKRQRAELTVTAKAERVAQMGEMMANGLDRMEALVRFATKNSDGRGGVQSMESRINGTTAYYMGEMPSFRQLIQESSFAGVEVSSKNLNDYLKESFGVDSGNPLAKKAWGEVSATRKKLIDHFNRKGGDVAQLANYRNPQSMDSYSVMRRGGKKGDTFVQEMMQWVDRNEYINPDGTQMTDAQMKEFLQHAYATVATDGASKPPGEGGGASSVANRMKAHRQIHFKSPEAYAQAMKKYGSGGLEDQVRGGIETMARDIAMIDRFGPNAIHEFKVEYADAVRETGKTDSTFLRAFDSLSGQTKTHNVAVAHWFSEARSAMVASRLGSMLLSQVADAGTSLAVTQSLGIHADQFLKWVSRMPTSEARDMARLHRLGLETNLDTIARFASDVSASGFFGKAATSIPTIQGANLATKTLRQAVGLAIEAKLGDLVTDHADWGSVSPGNKRMLESFGIGEKDFAIWKLAEPTLFKGDRVLGPDAIDAIPTSVLRKALGLKTLEEAEIARQEAAIRLVTYTVEHTHQAVLQPSAMSSAVLGGDRGVLTSELGKTVLQFKSFAVAFYRQMLGEQSVFAAEGSSTNRAMFNAKLIATTSILGGMSLLANDILSGKDPRKVWDSNDPKVAAEFGWKAMMKGGGLGYFGDILETVRGISENPMQAAGLLGPVGGYAVEAAATAVHGVAALATQDEKDIKAFTKGAYKSMTGIMPGQNLWFLKGFLHNVILDDLQEMASPGYKARAQKRAAQAGQGYWLGMDGETRAPNFGNMAID